MAHEGGEGRAELGAERQSPNWHQKDTSNMWREHSVLTALGRRWLARSRFASRAMLARQEASDLMGRISSTALALLLGGKNAASAWRLPGVHVAGSAGTR